MNSPIDQYHSLVTCLMLLNHHEQDHHHVTLQLHHQFGMQSCPSALHWYHMIQIQAIHLWLKVPQQIQMLKCAKQDQQHTTRVYKPQVALPWLCTSPPIQQLISRTKHSRHPMRHSYIYNLITNKKKMKLNWDLTDRIQALECQFGIQSWMPVLLWEAFLDNRPFSHKRRLENPLQQEQ